MPSEDVKAENVRKEAMSKILEVALKIRVHRQWQKTSAVTSARFSDCEMLILELINRFGPITEQAFVKILGLSPSSINEVTKRLSGEGFLTKEKAVSDRRKKPLSLTEPKGKEAAEEIVLLNTARYQYLLSEVPIEQLKSFISLLEIINKTVNTKVMVEVFDRYK